MSRYPSNGVKVGRVVVYLAFVGIFLFLCKVTWSELSQDESSGEWRQTSGEVVDYKLFTFEQGEDITRKWCTVVEFRFNGDNKVKSVAKQDCYVSKAAATRQIGNDIDISYNTADYKQIHTQRSFWSVASDLRLYGIILMLMFCSLFVLPLINILRGKPPYSY